LSKDHKENLTQIAFGSRNFNDIEEVLEIIFEEDDFETLAPELKQVIRKLSDQGGLKKYF
jgi:hypothetical protein